MVFNIMLDGNLTTKEITCCIIFDIKLDGVYILGPKSKKLCKLAREWTANDGRQW